MDKEPTFEQRLTNLQKIVKSWGYNSTKLHYALRIPKHVKPCPKELLNNLNTLKLIGGIHDLKEFKSCIYVDP